MNEKRNKILRDFLLSFFPKESKYYEKEVNGFWLVKQFNKIWTVAIFTRESYMRRKKHQEEFRGKRYKLTRRNRH